MVIGTNSPAFQVWVGMVRGYRRVRGALDSALKLDELPPLEWYDVLLELEREGAPVRASDLEQRLLVAQYNLSRLLDRLEKEGLIAREAHPDDGRSRLISITHQGLAMRRQMWLVYRRVIEGSIGALLTQNQARELAALLKLTAGGSS